jgi:hypothetical protein
MASPAAQPRPGRLAAEYTTLQGSHAGPSAAAQAKITATHAATCQPESLCSCDSHGLVTVIQSKLIWNPDTLDKNDHIRIY